MTFKWWFWLSCGARRLLRSAPHLVDHDHQGFSLHAAVRCDADERQRLEQLYRYVTRPALANERVQINAAGQVVLKLKTAWRDGNTHMVMSPLEFMQQLATPALLSDRVLACPAGGGGQQCCGCSSPI